MKWLGICLWFMLLGVWAIGQTTACPSSGKVRLKRELPEVYLSFEGIEKREPKIRGQSGDVVLLRLHNNSVWAIETILDSLYGPEKRVDFRVCDRILTKIRPNIHAEPIYESPGQPPGHASDYQTAWIPPGETMPLSVPKEHLAYFSWVRVYFNYEWGGSLLDISTPNPVSHSVRFDPHDIPELMRKKYGWLSGERQ